jgi:RNA polymerase sigma-70 factor (ECF subfamily)
MELDDKTVENLNNHCNKELCDKDITALIVDRKDVLYKIAFLHLKNEEDSLDAVNEAILKAYKSYKKLKEPKLFNTWITRILINCANDHLKKRNKTIYLEDFHLNIRLKDLISEEKDIDQEMDLYDAVDKLKGLSKTVIILKYFEDYTIDNIAEILSCSTSKVKNNLHKALTQLRKELKEGSKDGK